MNRYITPNFLVRKSLGLTLTRFTNVIQFTKVTRRLVTTVTNRLLNSVTSILDRELCVFSLDIWSYQTLSFHYYKFFITTFLIFQNMSFLLSQHLLQLVQYCYLIIIAQITPIDTGRKLNEHERFNLRPVSMGKLS